jgi:hypothetical protein
VAERRRAHARLVIFKRRKQDRLVGPTTQHGFVEPQDPRGGLAVAGVSPMLLQGPSLAMTEASVRPARCAMRGCSRLRDDPIHDAG